MPKVLSFANLVAPTCTVHPGLAEAVVAGQAAAAPQSGAVRAMTKADRREFLKRASTAWPCLTLTEGVNPALRISGDNPPQLLHGFTADYDHVGKSFTNTELVDLANRCAYPPAAAGPSLSGDGVHAIWLFKEPIPVLGNAEYARKVMRVCYSKLRVGNYMQGFDEAFKNPDRLLSIDPENFGWLAATPAVVDEVSTRMWAASVTADFRFEGPTLDLDKVHEKINQLFPGRWVGPFSVGARGPRFWDATATDATAAVITSSGIVYFSDGGGFKPWGSILGSDVTSKLSAESLGELTKPWYYDVSKKEYVLEDTTTGDYRAKNRTQTLDRLELSGLDDDLDRKRALVYVEDHKSVIAVVTLANQRRGLLKQGGLTYINATQTKPIAPSTGQCDFIQGLMRAMFPDGQLDFFLSWLKDSLQCVLDAEPSYSQAVFLAGDVESGKSLLQYRVLTPLFGGKYGDPMPHLLGESGFNSELADAGHWLVSDQEGARNASQRASFTQKVKAVTANPSMSVHAKFATPVTLFTNARLTFSFNTTSECLAVIPRLGSDILGKMMLFSIPTHGYFAGHDKRHIESAIAAELPAFAHWLLNDYVVPDAARSTGRYRTKSYHCPALMSIAKAAQDSSEVLDWVSLLFSQNTQLKTDYFDKGLAAEFSAAHWLQLIGQTTGNNQSLTPNRLSAHLQSLAKQFPTAVTARLGTKEKVYLFSINYKLLTELA